MIKQRILKILQLVYQYKMTLLFITFWLHISILNLMFVNYSGPVFLWEENTALKTIGVHLFIALLSTLCFYLVNQLRHYTVTRGDGVRDIVWAGCSLFLLFAIFFVLD